MLKRLPLFVLFLLLAGMLVPSRALAVTCISGTSYSAEQIAALKTNFNTLASSCTQSVIDDAWSAIRTVVVNKADSSFAAFLRNYFKGCDNNDVPRPVTGPLADELLEKPFADVDDGFERRLQRGLASAISDKLVDEINAAGGVVALGNQIEGTTTVAADCAKRTEILRILELLRQVTEGGRKIAPSFGDEVYSRFRTLINDQGPPLQMNGYVPAPSTYPWLGVFQPAIWRAMRMVKNHSVGVGGDAFLSATVRTAFADDIRAVGTALQKHRDLIVDYGLLVTDGGILAQNDPFLDPIFGGAHELGNQQTQIKAIDRLVDLMPIGVAQSIKTVVSKHGLGTICRLNNNANDSCVIPIGEPSESFENFSYYSAAAVKLGACQISQIPCSRDMDCPTATHQWGPSGRTLSRCPLPQKSCPFAPYTSGGTTKNLARDEACMAYGVSLVQVPLIGRREDNRSFGDGLFPPDTPQPVFPRPNYFPEFTNIAQHELNHAVTSWFIDESESLRARRDQLIDQACDDLLQYLHASHTFCGRPQGCTCRANCACSSQPQEFFAGIAQRYLTDTQAVLNLAWARWSMSPQKKEPINQFLFVAGIYSLPRDQATRTIPFYFQVRYTDAATTVGNGGYYPVQDGVSRSYGSAQYRTSDTVATLDGSGRVSSFQDQEGYSNFFTYDGVGNVSGWVRWRGVL